MDFRNRIATRSFTKPSALTRSLWLAGALLLTQACEEDAAVGTVPQLPLPTLPPDPIPVWLESTARPFEGSHLSLPHTDIEFLREIVGDARIVSLGEATHGTRDFFEMKARILRFLVEEMGFNSFAIEASWPESRRLDRYVRTGEGDPEVLLSGLYYWTWRTESVLEMIEWMRAHNEAGGDISFHGFDMQFPGMALHNVREFFLRSDPERADTVAERLECLDRFANGPDGRQAGPLYRNQSSEYRTECGASLEEVRRMLGSKRLEYEAATSSDAFEVALQSLRVAFQYHLRDAGWQYRDESMAENTGWISRRIGPEGRLVLWAHNYHVSTQPYAQGSYLREAFGDDMVVVAFSAESGWFTAVRQRGSEFLGLDTFQLERPPLGSYEDRFGEVSIPRFILDLRSRHGNPSVSAWLTTQRPFRDIGCCYDNQRPELYWDDTPLAEWFDVVIHFEATRGTVILPARYPESW